VTHLEREKREQEQVAHQHHLQDIRHHQDDYWHQVDLAVMRNSGAGYDEAVRLLIELRGAADQFKVVLARFYRVREFCKPNYYDVQTALDSNTPAMNASL